MPVRCRVQPGAAGCCWVLPQAVRMCCHFQVLPGAARLPVCRVRLSGSCRGCVLAARLLTTILIEGEKSVRLVTLV